MKRRAAAAFVVAVAWMAACGGRVDGGFGSSGSSTSTGTSGGTTTNAGQSPGEPGRPPIAPMSNAAVASAIAEDYCKAFSSCCVGDGQPPIDVAHCRELTSPAVEKELDAGGASETSAHDAKTCIAAIHTRIAACAKEDLRWVGTECPIFAPVLIEQACHPLLPNHKLFSFVTCSASMPCPESGTCAIDACTSAQPLGAACFEGACLDTATCVAGKCTARSEADVGSACTNNDDCRVGLVCFEATCAPTRDHPDLATHESSPFRIGSDTCRAYSYL